MKQHLFWRRGEFWGSAGELAVLAAVFLTWYWGREVSGPGLAAALCSAGLFAAICLRFVPEWLAFWRRERAGQADLPLSGPSTPPRGPSGATYAEKQAVCVKPYPFPAGCAILSTDIVNGHTASGWRRQRC